MRARVVGEYPLNYTFGENESADRAAHVRAASGIATMGGRFVVIQDDAATLGICVGGVVDAIDLPRGAGGRRRFETRLGNKHEKLDLEACCVIDGAFYAFASGSTAKRETIVHLVGGSTVEMIDAAPLYRALREAVAETINIEGAAWYGGDDVRLFHRGNCGPDDPGPAMVHLAWAGAKSRVTRVDRFDLGTIDGVRLGFTDAVARDGETIFLAAAEASPNAIEDGDTLGTRIGVIDRAGVVRMCELALDDGSPLKAEGITLDPKIATRAWIVDDPDDPDRASRLFELALDGF